MDIRDSLKQQIDQLAAALDVEPGYLKNATAPTLEKRLAELEEMLPDDGAADDEQAAEADAGAAIADAAPPAADAAAADTAVFSVAVATLDKITGTRRVTARCRFRGQVNGRSTWVSAGETVTMTAEDAAEAVADRVATWAR